MTLAQDPKQLPSGAVGEDALDAVSWRSHHAGGIRGGYWEAPHTLCPERGGYYSVSLPGVVGKTLCATKTSKGVL